MEQTKQSRKGGDLSEAIFKWQQHNVNICIFHPCKPSACSERNFTEVKILQNKIWISYTDQLGYLTQKDLQKIIKKYPQK
jgi:hypothetical protein